MTQKEWEYINERFERLEKLCNRLMVAIAVMLSKEQAEKANREIKRMEAPPNPEIKEFIEKYRSKITEHD